MREIDVAQWSAEMTARERARLVIALELKNWESVEGAPSEIAGATAISPGIAADIQRAWASCPRRQQEEFYRLISLKTLIWLTATWDVSHRLIRLHGLAADETLLFLVGRFSEDHIRFFVQEMSRIIKAVRYILALVEAAETKHFGGMHVLGRDRSHPLCTVWLASRVIQEVVEGHNRGLMRAFAEPEEVKVSTPIPMPVHTLLLDANPAVDERWVQAQLSEMENFAFGCW